MIRGHLIVIEGIDGAGTTTQAEMLRRAFAERGLPAHVTAQPSTGPIGCLIRQVLSGRLVSNGPTGTVPLGWATMALLFAADRQDHQESEIEPNLRDGVTVICDRYIYSSVVYQSLTADLPEVRRWVAEINRYARKPDLVLYIRVEAEEAFRRRQARGARVEIFDDPELQKRLVAAYDSLGEMFPDLRFMTVDGGRPADEVARDCWTEVEKLRRAGAPS